MIDSVRHQDDVTVVEIGDRFDAVSASEVKAELQALIEEGNIRLVLSLAKMDFIDSAGLGVLVSCLRRAAAEGGDLRLAAAGYDVRAIKPGAAWGEDRGGRPIATARCRCTRRGIPPPNVWSRQPAKKTALLPSRL